VLANVMIFAGTVLYPYYHAGDAHWHISSMADQVAAAGVMMVEESLLTIGLFCWLFLKVAREGEERQRLLDYALSHGIELDERRAARAVAAGREDELWERLRERTPGVGAGAH
jgi:putative membrane protein